MRAFVLSAIALIFAGAGVVPTQGEPYWFAFEFDDPNDVPQGEGWLRRYQPEPFGYVENGVLTYDSSDPRSYDFWEYYSSALDPGPNEVFVCEWKLWTEWVSYWADPSVAIQSDDAWVVCLVFGPDNIHSFCENVDIPVEPGWHSYQFISPDMRTYELYVDGALTREGWFAHRFVTSLVIWGDGGDGVASTHRWDWLRFGVIGAPLTGDANCDGMVSFADINPFVQALIDPEAYQYAYPDCWAGNVDINADGTLTFGDINPFIDLLRPP